jgi:gluconolactonase
VFRLLPAGNLELLATDMSHPNGLAFSPDEKLLYVSNTRPDPHLRVYRVRRDGKLGHSNVFAEMPYVPAPQGTTFVTDEGRARPATEKGGVPDGLKVDIEGRIYCTGPGGIWVWEPDGTYLGLITLPELPANLAWGEHDHRSLYITARTSVYRLRTGVPGIAPL